MNKNSQLTGDEKTAASMATDPAYSVTALFETLGTGDAPVTRFSFPWLDAQGKIQMIQAFLCH